MQNVLSLPFEASGDLSAKQYYLVKKSTANLVALAGANDRVLGVLTNDPESGEGAAVQVLGTARVVLGGTVSAGDLLKADSSGKAVEADTSAAQGAQNVFAQALEAGVSGDQIVVLLMTAITAADLDVLTVINSTGSTIAAGKLVYISGFDNTSGRPKIALADADVNGAQADYVTRESILTATEGVVGKTYQLTAQNTDGVSAAGDPLYLDTTAGGFTATAPVATGAAQQVVGHARTKHASTGIVEFNLQTRDMVARKDLAADLIDGTKIADDAVDSEHIAAGAIDPEHFAALAVETAAIAASAVTTAKLAATNSYKSTSATGEVGFATGAGGAVTQQTNRTTGVTVDKPTGTITTDAASLGAELAAEFTVTNSQVAIGDTVVLSIQSGTNGGNTAVAVTTVAAGSFKIKVSNNNAAGGTAETGAILINFAVIKAVSA